MWHLQLNPQGIAFWDSYVHPDCEVHKSQEEQPFKNMIYTEGLRQEDERLLSSEQERNRNG